MEFVSAHSCNVLILIKALMFSLCYLLNKQLHMKNSLRSVFLLSRFSSQGVKQAADALSGFLKA